MTLTSAYSSHFYSFEEGDSVEEALLSLGDSVHSESDFRSALSHAAYNGFLSLVKGMLESDKFSELSKDSMMYGIYNAKAMGHDEVAELLWSKVIEIEMKTQHKLRIFLYNGHGYVELDSFLCYKHKRNVYSDGYTRNLRFSLWPKGGAEKNSDELVEYFVEEAIYRNREAGKWGMLSEYVMDIVFDPIWEMYKNEQIGSTALQAVGFSTLLPLHLIGDLNINEPGQVYYYEPVDMDRVSSLVEWELTEDQARKVLEKLEEIEEALGRDEYFYNWISSNCATFPQEFFEAAGIDQEEGNILGEDEKPHYSDYFSEIDILEEAGFYLSAQRGMRFIMRLGSYISMRQWYYSPEAISKGR